MNKYKLYMIFGIVLLDLSNFDTSKVINTSQMFQNCSGLEELNISSFNTSNVFWM